MSEEDTFFVSPSEGLATLNPQAKEGKISMLAGTPARKIGLIILSIILVISIVHYRLVWNEWRQSRAGDAARKQESAQPLPAPHTYTKEVVVTAGQPVRVDIPLGYRMDYSWGYAPLDTRTSCDPQWIDATKVPAHIEGGQMVQWREWRLNREYDGKATVTCTFTQIRKS